MNLLHKMALVATVPLFLLSSCKKDKNTTPNETTTPTGKTKVADAYVVGAGMKATLWRDTNFVVGYNKFYVTIADSASGATISNASINTSIMMMMGTTMMSGPVEQPSFADDLYSGAMVFTMASGNGMGQWSVMADVTNPVTSKQGTATFSVDVASPTYNPVIMQMGSDNKNYIITLLQPMKPKMGMNNLEIVVSQQVNSMAYTPMNNLQIQVIPEMPSMGGMTTPNNQNPTITGNGHYVGKVNFDMTGAWRLDFNVMQGADTLMDDAYLDFTF